MLKDTLAGCVLGGVRICWKWVGHPFEAIGNFESCSLATPYHRYQACRGRALALLSHNIASKHHNIGKIVLQASTKCASGRALRVYSNTFYKPR